MRWQDIGGGAYLQKEILVQLDNYEQCMKNLPPSYTFNWLLIIIFYIKC